MVRMGEGRDVQRVLVGKPEGNRPLGDPDVDGSIILRRIFSKWEGIFFISEERTTTRVSPNGIPRGIYSIMYSLE